MDTRALVGHIFRAHGIIYFSNPNNTYTAPRDYTGLLLLLGIVRDNRGLIYYYFKSIENRSKNIYVLKIHFRCQIVEGTLKPVRNLLP
jgi:hypothetical protein